VTQTQLIASAGTQGPYLGMLPMGKKVTATVWTINRFAGDKIAVGRMLGDRLGLMPQLGVNPV
jgi:predicted ester cyclase